MDLQDKPQRTQLKYMVNDLLMMLLLFMNLVLIVFDFAFGGEPVQSWLIEYTPTFFHLYNDYIHQNFVWIDAAFVAVFLAEFVVRWSVAIVNHHYHRWFFFPFVHWYDLIGCIPVGSLRFLRILRLFSILYRLHRLQVINLTKTYLFSLVKKYWEVLMEEISDRVVVNVLRDVQNQVNQGNPLLEKVIEEVIFPHKTELVKWVSYRISQATRESYRTFQPDLKLYVDQVIRKAVEESDDVKTLEQIPLVGTAISGTLQRSVSDIVYNVVDTLFADMSSDKNQMFVAETVDTAIDSLVIKDEDQLLSKIVVDMVNRSLELVIEQVEVKQWLLKELEEKERKRQEKEQRKREIEKKKSLQASSV